MDPVGITNLALLRIGAQAQVSSINPSDGSTEGDAASVLYQPTMDSLMRAAHWNFTRRQVAGTLVAASYQTPENALQTLPQPPQPWLYAYSVPADNLKIRFLQPVWDSTSSTNPIPISTYSGASPYLYLNPQMIGAVPYVEAIILDTNNNEIKVILTNLENAQIVYTARVTNCDLWDVSFVEAASCTLGSWLVNALARNAPLSADMQRMAMGLINQARVRDGNEGVTTMDREASWMEVRGGLAPWSVGPYYNSYDTLGWPGGMWL